MFSVDRRTDTAIALVIVFLGVMGIVAVGAWLTSLLNQRRSLRPDNVALRNHVVYDIGHNVDS